MQVLAAKKAMHEMRFSFARLAMPAGVSDRRVGTPSDRLTAHLAMLLTITCRGKVQPPGTGFCFSNVESRPRSPLSAFGVCGAYMSGYHRGVSVSLNRCLDNCDGGCLHSPSARFAHFICYSSSDYCSPFQMPILVSIRYPFCHQG